MVLPTSELVFLSVSSDFFFFGQVYLWGAVAQGLLSAGRLEAMDEMTIKQKVNNKSSF